MSTRTVTGTVYGINGSPLEGKRVEFNLLQLGVAVDFPVYPQQSSSALILTDSNGEFSVDLWVNAESNVKSIYEVVFHDDTRGRFIIPVGSGSIDISDLLINHGPSTSPQEASALSLKADRDAGNLTSLNKQSWREALDVGDPISYDVTQVTSDSTLSKGVDRYVEQSSSAIVTTLWASPSNGDIVSLFNYSGGDNSVNGNGNLIRTGSGSTSTSISIGSDYSVDLIFNGSVWIVSGYSIPFDSSIYLRP